MSTRWGTGLAAVAIAFALAPICRYPLAEIGVLLLALSVGSGGLAAALRRPGSSWWCLCAAAWVVLAAVCALGRLPLSADVLQMLFLLVVGVAAFRQGLRPDGYWLGAAVALGTGLSLLVALGQVAAEVEAARVAGLHGGRASFGVAMAVGVPWLLNILARSAAARPGGRFALVVAPAVLILTLWHLPALLLVLALTAAWIGLVGRGGERRLVLLGLLVGVALLVAPGLPAAVRQREALAASVSTVDPSGYVRRWVLELRAAQAAVSASPWLGHGPGTYQRVVSSGYFRQALPPTLESTVERGSQCGYLVLAVEFGLPLALLIAGAILHAAGLAWRGPPTAAGHAGVTVVTASYRRGLALCLLASAAGLAVTPMLVRGTGVLVAALLGAAMACRDPHSSALPPAPRNGWRTLADSAGVQGLALVAALALSAACLALGLCPRRGVLGGTVPWPALDTGAPGALLLTLEAEAAAIGPASPFAIVSDPDASGGQCLEVALVDKELLLADGGLTLPFRLATGGRCRLWLRCWWPDGCANSIAVGLSGSAPVLVGNDGTYRTWHWLAGPVLELSPGAHSLRLLPREPSARVDVLALVAGPGEPDMPNLAAARMTAAGPARAARLDCTGRPERTRFLVGVGGTYAPGPEAVLTQLGVPYERLQNEDLTDAEALGTYAVIWITKPGGPLADTWRALHAYVRGGGTAIVEEMLDPRGGNAGSGGPDERALLPTGGLGGGAMSHARHRVIVRAQDSPFFQDLPAEAELYEGIDVSLLPPLAAGDGESHGRLLQRGRELGVAFSKRGVGAGTVYALALPLGFISMWRGPEFDPLARRIVLDALGDRYEPLYASLVSNPVEAPGVRFADDFMRAPGETGPWEVLSGTFEQIGSAPPAPPQFSRRQPRPGPTDPLSVRLVAPALAVAGSPEWRDYRVRAALRADEGDAGIWLTTSTGRQLQARISGPEASTRLLACAGGEEVPLASGPLSGPGVGWRRLSLWHDGAAWQVWVDGLPLLRVPAPGETTSGRFGLVAASGVAHLDDVSVRDVAALVPGTDACVGEEGSCRADYPLRAGVEQRGVCSGLWALRPDPLGRHAVQSLLPLFGPATVVLDGETLGTVDGAAEAALVCLPEGRVPSRDLLLIAPTWRDYLFAGQAVDWYGTGGTWGRVARWACDQQWEWLGIRQGPTPAVWWYRPWLEPPYALATEAALAMRQTRSDEDFDETPRDLNLVLAGGNGESLAGAWLLRTGPAGSEGCTLLRNGQVLAQAPALGLPPEGGHALHHRWVNLRAIVEPRRIRVWFDGREAIVHESEEDFPAGQIGVWTQDNAIQVARIALSAPKIVPFPRR